MKKFINTKVSLLTPTILKFDVEDAVKDKVVSVSIQYTGKGLSYHAFCDKKGVVTVVLNMIGFTYNPGKIVLTDVPISFYCEKEEPKIKPVGKDA